MRFSVKKNFIEGTREDRRIYLTRAAQRIVILLAVAVLVLGIYYFKEDISAWFRSVQARHQEEEAQGSAFYSRIAFEPDSDNIYTLLKSNLVVMNKGNFKIYAPDGRERLSLQLSYSRPALCSGGELVVAYDREGVGLTVAKSDSLVTMMEMPGGIISASVNKTDYIAVVYKDERYRAAVCVYDERQNLIYQWKTSEYYVLRAVLSPDGKTMAVTALMQNEGVFISRVFYFDLSREEYLASADISGTILSNTYYLSESTVCMVGDDRTIVTDLTGKVLYEYAYSNDMLKTGSCSDSFVALTMLDRTSGLGAKVVLFSAEGDRALSINTDDDIRRLSANGDFIAVLYTQSIQLFNSEMEPLCGVVDVSQVRDILVSADGAVLLIYASDAGFIDLISAFQDAAQ